MSKEKHIILYSGKYDILPVPESEVLHVRVEYYSFRFIRVHILKVPN